MVCPQPRSSFGASVECPVLSPEPAPSVGTAKYPESLCPRSVLPPLERRDPPPPRTLLPVLRSYGLMRQSRWLSFPSVLHLVPGVLAGCYQPLLPTASSRLYLCKSFPRCLVPYHDGPTECFYLFLPRCHRPSPRHYGSASRFYPRMRLSRGLVFRGCRHFVMFRPLSLLVSQIAPTAAKFPPQSSRDFYIRAYRASLPPHAPDMLSVRYRQLTEKGLSPFKICSLVGCSSASLTEP
jgi:hypothetical protein